MDQAHDTLTDDPLSADPPFESRPGAQGATGGPEDAGRSGGGVALLATLLGALLLAAGVLLITAPLYSWQATEVGRRVAAMGFGHGLLILSGLVVLAIGLLGRSFGGQRRSAQSRENDVSVVVDQLVQETLLLRRSLSQMSDEVGSVSENQTAIMHQYEREEQLRHEKNYDALFRLAASLDQLHARMDERVNALVNEVQERVGAVVGGMGTLVEEVRQNGTSLARTLEESIARIAAAPSAAPAPARAELEADESPALDHLASELEVLVDLEGGPLGEDVDVDLFEGLEDLDSLVGRHGNEPRPPAQTPDPAPGTASDAGNQLDSLLSDPTLGSQVFNEDPERG